VWGMGTSWSQRTKSSATTLLALTSRIDTLLEWLDAKALDGIDEQLVGRLAQLEIGGGDILDHVRHLGVGHGRPEQRSELGLLVGPPADGHLVILLAVLLDPEDADVADVVVAAGIDAAGNVDVQAPQVPRHIEIAEAAGELRGNGDRARISEAAIVEARAGDNVGDEPDIGDRHADRLERAPQLDKIALTHVRQDEILLVPNPDLAGA